MATPTAPYDAPEISVVVPTYRSEATVGRCLSQLERQTHPSYELIVVDSSPDNACARVVAAFRMVRLERSPVRLLPQEARTVGARLARGRLLVFTDPDCYAPPDWLARLAAAVGETTVVSGGLACHGRRWFDRGIHLCKFSKWLPGRRPRLVDVGPTANLALPRNLFEQAGGFDGPGDPMHGDATLSWRLTAQGHPVQLVPEAWVSHHHLQTFGGFLRERYRRGRGFAEVREGFFGSNSLLSALRWVAVPLRLGSNLFHVARHAFGAGQSRDFLITWPLVALGFVASLAGEARGYGTLVRHSARLRGSVSS